MQSPDEQDIPVKAKAVLIDPRSMTVVWMNESAAQGLSDVGISVPGVTIEQALPMGETLGIPEALKSVAETGVARHLRTNLVSTSQGSMAIATSLYRLPDGTVLVLTENAWQPLHSKPGADGARRQGRRHRS